MNRSFRGASYDQLERFRDVIPGLRYDSALRRLEKWVDGEDWGGFTTEQMLVAYENAAGRGTI